MKLHLDPRTLDRYRKVLFAVSNPYRSALISHLVELNEPVSIEAARVEIQKKVGKKVSTPKMRNHYIPPLEDAGLIQAGDYLKATMFANDAYNSIRIAKDMGMSTRQRGKPVINDAFVLLGIITIDPSCKFLGGTNYYSHRAIVSASEKFGLKEWDVKRALKRLVHTDYLEKRESLYARMRNDDNNRPPKLTYKQRLVYAAVTKRGRSPQQIKEVVKARIAVRSILQNLIAKGVIRKRFEGVNYRVTEKGYMMIDALQDLYEKISPIETLGISK